MCTKITDYKFMQILKPHSYPSDTCNAIFASVYIFVLLGIQQKYIIVTCNYVAREQGVTKLMSVTDAVEKCPQLVLVKGEDLTNYREISYKVTGQIILFFSFTYFTMRL